MIGELRPSGRYKKGRALALLKAIGTRTIHHQGAARAECLDALDLETGAGDLRVHDYVCSLILACQYRICDTADVEYTIGVSANRRRDGADDSQGGARGPGQDGRPSVGEELAETVYVEGI